MITPTLVDYRLLSEDYERIQQALIYLEQNYIAQPSLEDIAASVGLSEYHFQRLFTRWVGISPKRFLQYLTKEHAKLLLDESSSILEAAYQTGLSSPSRLHDLFVSCEAVTPGEYKSRGEGLEISYGIHYTPFGQCLLAVTDRGICGLNFVDDGNRDQVLESLHRRWSQALMHEDADRTAPLVGSIFPLYGNTRPDLLRLYLNGTNFQIKVWEALLRIPPGKLVAYEDIARYLGMPQAARAVSRAVADNPIAVIIPCHRVVRKMGMIGGYRWGTARKQAILGWEMAKAEE